MTAPLLLVEVGAIIRVSAQVDLVRHYSNYSTRMQNDYRGFPIAEHGAEYEWERPLAYLLAATDDGCGAHLMYGSGVVREDVDVDHCDYHVRGRNGSPRLVGESAHWTEDDFAALAAAVPWLQAVHDQHVPPPVDETLAWPHLSRDPAPADIPLIGDSA